MDYSKISKLSCRLIKKYKTQNPFELASSLGINVAFKNLGSLKGFYTTILRNRFIVINSNLDEISSKIVLTHEIGHDRMHRNLGIQMFKDENCVSLKKDTTEIEANYFTAEFLVSDNRCIELIDNNCTCSEIASELCVHKELVVLKAKILNSKGYNYNIPYISDSNYLSKVSEDCCKYNID